MHRPLRLAALALGLVACLPIASAEAYPAGSTTLLSRPSGLAVLPAVLVNDSQAGSFALSADGCRVAFSSKSDGLSAADRDDLENVYVRDHCAGTTTLVSRASGADGAAANGMSTQPTISRDGSTVAFVSEATNLTATQTPAGELHVYVRRLDTHTTTMADVAPDGAPGDAISGRPVLDADGDTVAFDSYADNLVPGVSGSPQQVYVRTLSGTPTTVLASRADSVAGTVGNGTSIRPSLDGSGRYVAFESDATGLVPGDSAGKRDVFVRDLQTHTITLVSRDGLAGETGSAGSFEPALSGDGTRIAFTTAATNLFANDGNGNLDVVVRTLASGVNELASRADGAAGAQSNYESRAPSLDATGARVAFIGRGSNLVPGSTVILSRIIVRDVDADTTRLAAPLTGGGTPNDRGLDHAEGPSIDGTGTKVAFQTASDGILGGDRDDFLQVALRDLTANATHLASRPTGTAPIPGRDGGAVDEGGGRTVSADGRYVVFASGADHLSADDDDRFVNVFRRDLRTDETVLVSRGASGAANGASWQPAISADGTRVAFGTDAPNLGGNSSGQVVVRDLQANTTTVAGIRSDNGRPVVGAGDPAISADGTHVAFVAGLLSVTGSGSSVPQVFVRDLTAGTTTLASRATGAAGTVANGFSTTPSLSADGSRVAFQTDATNLDAGDTTTDDDIYVRDLDENSTHLASGAATISSTGGAQRPSLSADGTKVAFESFAYRTGGVHIYVRTLGGAVEVADRDDAGDVLAGGSQSASISADGTVVAFANDPDRNDNTRIVVRDLDAGTTTTAAAPDRAASAPSLSGSGSCVAFTSTATDVGAAHAGGDFAQLWLRTLDGSCAGEPAPVLTLSGPSGALPGTSATFTFSASGPAPRFECRVDGAAYKACTSPLTVRGLGPGVHKVEVRAIDAHGNVSSVGSKTVSVAGPPAPAPATGSAGGGERPVTVPGPAVRAPASSVARAVTFTGTTLKRLARGRAIGVPMRCTASTRCAGTVTLSLGGKRLARATFSIRARKAATVRVRLTRAGRRALRGKRSPRIAVVATLRGGATARTTAKLK